MVTARTVSIYIAAYALAGLVACVITPRDSLTTSADRLERNARALALDARDDHAAGYPATYSRDAHLLAEDAHELRRTVEGRVSADADVRAAFERVSRSYHLVRDEVDRSASRVARADLRPVTESYLDVERAMGGYPDRRDRDYRVSERR